MKRFPFLFGVLVALFVLVRCSSHEKIISVDPKYRKWVSGYSSGVVSRTNTIRVELRKEVDSTIFQALGTKNGMSEKLLEDIFEISPAVEGKPVWVNERTIEFIPDKELISGQLYTVSFDLEKVALVEDGYEEFVFQFATYQQKVSISNANISAYDDYNLEWYYISGNLETTDVADTAAIKKVLTATYKGKEIPVRIEPDYSQNEFRFFVDSILRTEQEEEIVLSLDGKPISSFSEEEQKIKVPSLHDFELTNATVVDVEDQSITLTFSEPILANQDFKGLIDLQNVEGETFSVYYNEVTVFLPHRIEGDYFLQVDAGLRNVKGYTMKNGSGRKLFFHGPNPLVRIKGEGSILPDSKGLIFPFETISLHSVTVRIIKVYEENAHHFLQVNDLNQANAIFRFGKVMVERKLNLGIKSGEEKIWTTHVLDLEKWIRPEQGAIYRVSIKFGKKDAICDCETTESEENNEQTDQKDDWSERVWDADDWDNGYDSWEGYNSDASPCSNSYYEGKAVSRNILASNIGIIFKLDAFKTGHAFLTDMITAQPMANATVEYVDFQKQLIASGKTDANGMLTSNLPKKPFLLVAKYGKQRGYLKLGDGYSNSLSKFDVEGEEVQDGIKGYFYAERGVWRPGDSLYINFILQDLENTVPKNHPVRFTLTNPNGQEVVSMVKTENINGHYDFRTATSSSSPTGTYTALVNIGKREFARNFKVETVKPNRLKMKVNIPPFQYKDSASSIEATWLHGAPGKELRATVNVELNPSTTVFKGFKGYVFDSPIRAVNNTSVTLYDHTLDVNGKGWFKNDISNSTQVPGMLKAVYTTRVFEKGGDFSVDRFSLPFSPFEKYVGLEIPETQADNTLPTGEKHLFKTVVLDEQGKLVEKPTKLHVKIYRMEWRWWYEEYDDDMANFIGRNGNMVVYDTTIISTSGKSGFRFGINQPDYGRFLITVTDELGLHQTGQVVSIDWPYWNRGNRKTNEFAAMLNFACDKESYQKGETVKVSFPSPAAGKALISVETRKKILKKFWVDTQKGETTCSFQTTADMAPNAYVHVTLIQPHAATTNDLPIRMYGVVPILVDDPATHLHPVIKVPTEWRPETTAKVTVKEEEGKPMTYTLAIVDDGLLDLTRFKTPNPWATFYAKEALGIKTWDMYRDVIGAFSGKLDRLLSIGGDASADDGAGPKANRFKPMVYFLGPFTLPAGTSKTHSVELPTYVGSVRVMVVAHHEAAYGSAEETVTIKKPVMVLGTLPRVLGPGETIQLPVDIFAMEKNIKDVHVQITTNDFLQLNGVKQQNVSFAQIGDEMVNFQLKVAEKMGVAKIKIVATSGDEKAVQELEVDVRSPNPSIVESKIMELKPGESANLPVQMNGIKGSHHLQVELSTLPSMNLSGRMNELIHYPHGCIEQTTSAVFPQLFAMDIMNCSPTDQKVMNENIKAALMRYTGFQTQEGAFAYWPGESFISDWGTNYAGHFMLEAEQHGYTLPRGMKDRWIAFQKERANEWGDDFSYIAHQHARESNQLIQAYRLYTLALAGKAELGAMNRMKEIKVLGTTAKWRLGAAYYLAGQKEVAKQLTATLPLQESNYQEFGYTYGSSLRDKAMILEAAAMIHPAKTKELTKQIASILTSNQWLSTQEAGYCLLALTGGVKDGNGLKASVNGTAVQTTKALALLDYSEKELLSTKKYTVKNTSTKTLYINLNMEKVPLKGDEKTERNGLQMTVLYKDMDGKKMNPAKLVQGTDFYVEVTLKNPTKDQIYKEMCLQQLFPCGWEIHNARVFEEDGASNSFYQDFRDDRVYNYFTLHPNDSQTFKIQLNASYLGKFYLPAVYSEAMYRRSIHAQEKGMWVEVVKS